MMNIVFLDVDGVLNSISCLKEAYNKNKRPYSGYDYPFDKKCLLNLLHLVRSTDSYIVITSTWRRDDIGRKILLNELKKYDLDKRVIGYTEVLNQRRGIEIKKYLDNLDYPVNYIILDDDNDFDGLENHLINTNYEVGLTNEDVIQGKKLLLKNS